MKRIIVSVTNDLATDQRVYKVCKTLNEMGFDILLVGRKLKNSLAISRPYRIKKMRMLFNKGFLFYAEYNLRLFLLLLFSKKDILLANDLDTLLPNYLVSRLQNKKLVYDSHELFTEVPELISRPKVQKVWLKIERWILPKLENCYTVSESIAKYYNTKYNLNFEVIRNVPEKIESFNSIIPWKNEDNAKIILYQGALNVGRGLELMIDSMTHLNNHLLIFIGNGDIESELREKVAKLKLESKVQFLGRIEPIKLKSITPQADIGISLEEDLGLSYRYCLPNKIFDYIHAEIPLLVSELPEMSSIISKYNVGEILKEKKPTSLAKLINTFPHKKTIKEMQYLNSARNELCWNVEKNILIEIFNSFH